MSDEIRDEAAVLKDQAEAHKFEAQAEQARAETRKADADADRAVTQAEVSRISRDREVHKHAVELAQDEYHHVYRFITDVNAGSVKACMAQLATWARVDETCAIEICFTSPGGAIVEGMALFDFIQQLRTRGHYVTTSTIGWAASMAGILLQAGDVRVMSAESWLLIHEASFGAIGDFGEIEDKVEWISKVQDRILDIFAARSTMSKAAIKRKWNRKDWWLSSDEALKHGFVDEIR